MVDKLSKYCQIVEVVQYASMCILTLLENLKLFDMARWWMFKTKWLRCEIACTMFWFTWNSS